MNIKISENIKRLRKAKKITQEGLAEIFNVTPAAVSKWENNETYPDITLLFPLSHFFGVSIDELMGYDYMLIEEEIKKVKEEIHNAWYVNNDWDKAKELNITARTAYPNDYEIMVNYLFFTTGGMADNDPKVLIQNEEEINKKAAEGGFDISGATIVDPETSDRTQAYIDKFVELRAKKGMTPEKAKEILHTQYPYYGVMMVKMGDADGMVSGACHSTADTLRPCLQILKTKPGTKLVSAFFLIVVPDCEYGANGAFVFADSGLNQNPTPEELSAIAASSAESFQLLVEEEPIVAMLSHSTKGSAKHPDVDKMVEATRIAKEEHPELKLDGEFQLDAAIVPSVGASKAPGSEVAGKANVLVFPDLDAGNIGYKLAQRLGKAEAYGPVTQGIAKPVNDLSRGCSADDIVGVVAITAVQCQAEDK